MPSFLSLHTGAAQGRIAQTPISVVQQFGAAGLIQRQEQDTPDEGAASASTTFDPKTVDHDFKVKVTAVILAESKPGQEEDIRWIYYNNIVKEGGLDGLNKSTPWKNRHKKNKGGRLKAWLYAQGDYTYGTDPSYKPKKYATVMEHAESLFLKNEARIERVRKLVDDMFADPSANPHVGFRGQGNRNDMDHDTRYWKEARQYYWLQKEGKVKKRFVKKTRSKKGGTQFIFDSRAIKKYFKANPDMMPDHVKHFDETKDTSPE